MEEEYIMRRVVIVCFAVFIAVILSGCNGVKQSMTSEKQASSQKQESSLASDSKETETTLNQDPNNKSESEKQEQKQEVNIVIEPPQGWVAVEGSVLPVQYMKTTASFMVKEEPFQGTTLTDVVSEAKEIYNKTFNEVVYKGDPEDITVDGKEAVKIIFTCKVSNLNMKYEYVYLFAGSGVYVITFGDLADNFDSLGNDYEQILKNIHF